MYFFDGFYFLRLFYAINSLLKDSLHESDVCSLFINQLQGAKFFLALAEVRVLPISFSVRWWGFFTFSECKNRQIFKARNILGP